MIRAEEHKHLLEETSHLEGQVSTLTADRKQLLENVGDLEEKLRDCRSKFQQSQMLISESYQAAVLWRDAASEMKHQVFQAVEGFRQAEQACYLIRASVLWIAF